MALDLGPDGVADNIMEVDLAEGFKHTDTVDEIVHDMKKTLKVISEEVEMSRKTWGGDGHDMFDTIATEWGAEGQRLNRALDELALTLRESAFKGASTTDSSIADSFKGVKAGGLDL